MAEHLSTLKDNQDNKMADYIRFIETFKLFYEYGITTIMFQTYKTAISQCTCTTKKTEKIEEKLWGKMHATNCRTVQIHDHNSISKDCNPEVLFKLITQLFNLASHERIDELKRAVCSLMVHYMQIYFRDIEEYSLYIRDITRQYSIPDHGVSELKRLGLNSMAGKIMILDPSI